MNLALEIFNQLHVLVREISHIENAKENIVNILDDVMLNVDDVSIDLLGERKINKKLIRF